MKGIFFIISFLFILALQGVLSTETKINDNNVGTAALRGRSGCRRGGRYHGRGKRCGRIGRCGRRPCAVGCGPSAPVCYDDCDYCCEPGCGPVCEPV